MNQKDLKKVSEAAKQIYDYGCYFMSLLYVSLHTYVRNIPHSELTSLDELLKYYDTFIKKCWMTSDCYVKDPCAILEYLTGKKYSVKKAVVLDTSADIIIGRWYNPTTNFHHFVVMDRNNNVIWDSLGDSSTVKNGVIESYRLLYECK